LFATRYVSAFGAMVLSLAGSFTAPTKETFAVLVTGWVLCLGRHTITRIIDSAAERAEKHVSSYRRFFSRARWDPDAPCLDLFVKTLVPLIAKAGKIDLAGDDSTCAKSGRSVAFAGYFRDAVRSTIARRVVHWAHCWVVLSLQVRCPFWPRRVIAFPVMARLYRKEAHCGKRHPFRTRHELLLEMVTKVSSLLPEREFTLAVDGGYPSRELIRDLPRNVQLVSRMRSDAALNDLPPKPRKKVRGRRRQKGERLPSLADIAAGVKRWDRRMVVTYGRRRPRLLYSFQALWWHVAKARPFLVVIVRDPATKEKDDFFFTTDLNMDPGRVAELYAGRWAIEEAFRESKQLVGFDDVQGWSPRSVERQAPFALLTLSLVKAWYLQHVAPKDCPNELPSAAAILTMLRMAHWQQRISALSLPHREMRQFTKALRATLAAAS
jgi:hypothetical protein